MRSIGFEADIEQEIKNKEERFKKGFMKIIEDLRREEEKCFDELTKIKENLREEIEEVEHIIKNLEMLEDAIKRLRSSYFIILDMWHNLIVESENEESDKKKLYDEALKMRDIFNKFISHCEEITANTKKYILTESYKIYKITKISGKEAIMFSSKAKKFLYDIDILKNSILNEQKLLDKFITCIEELLRELKDKKQVKIGFR